MLEFDKFIQTDSTLHPHWQEITIGNIRFNSYDLGGHTQARKTWREYSANVDGIIYLIDSADRGRLQESKKELELLLEMPELENVPFVIFGNKVDKVGTLNEDELREFLGLNYN